MNNRDKKIQNCEFDYWIIFIFVNNDNVTEIALFENDGNWVPYHIDEAVSFEKARREIEENLQIKENQCFKDRYLSSSVDVNYKENTELNASGSYIRLKDKMFLQKTNKIKNFKWFSKENAFKKLHSKADRIAFERIFTEDSFWEGLNTEEL